LASAKHSPNGERTPNPVNGSKFYSNKHIEDAITELGPGSPNFQTRLNSTPPPTQIVFEKYDMNRPMGYGYSTAVGNPKVDNVKLVTAVWRKNAAGNWYLVTMYPHII
jgi:hypothetical protein